MKTRVLFIDNFDSFTFNLVDEFARRGCEVEVWRNTASAPEVFARLMAFDGPKLIVLSPGPGTPAEAGCCAELLTLAQGVVPVLGICLGHQVIVERYGNEVSRAPQVMHGKTSPITHDGRGLFQGLPSPLVVGRYHSLCARAQRFVGPLEISASYEGIVMGVHHPTLPIFGLQFHPESILTREGGAIIENALRRALETHEVRS